MFFINVGIFDRTYKALKVRSFVYILNLALQYQRCIANDRRSCITCFVREHIRLIYLVSAYRAYVIRPGKIFSSTILIDNFLVSLILLLIKCGAARLTNTSNRHRIKCQLRTNVFLHSIVTFFIYSDIVSIHSIAPF